MLYAKKLPQMLRSPIVLSTALVLMLCAKPVNKNVAAIINGDTITIAQVDTELVTSIRKMARANPFWVTPEKEKLALYRKNSLIRLIDKAIVLQEERRRGIVIDSAHIEQAFAEYAEKQFKGSEEAFLAYLEKMNISARQAKMEMAQALAFSALEDSLIRPVQTPDSALKAFYDKNPDQFRKVERKVSHNCLYKKLSYVEKPKRMLKLLDVILKARDSTLTKEALEQARAVELKKERKLAENILTRLRAGESFEKLAKQYSEDTTCADRGGYVKKIQKGYRGYPYSDSAFALRTGKFSGITEDEYGLFIIRADSDPETTITPFADIKEKMRKKADEPKRKQLLRELLQKHKPKIYMDTLALPGMTF